MLYKNIKQLLLLLFALVALTACHDDTAGEDIEPQTYRTVLIYLPWTGSADNLLDDFRTNLHDIKRAIASHGLDRERVVVMLAESASRARLFEIEADTTETELTAYTRPSYTTTAGIASILNDVKGFAPAAHYAMLVGGHGMGWLRASTWNGTSASTARLASAKEQPSTAAATPAATARPRLTRFFGSATRGYQTDVDTLATALQRTGMTLDYLLFDDCYMANVETAYCLKDVTRYLIACPTEILRYGMPYSSVFPNLLGTPYYNKVCEETVNFYESYTYEGVPFPYATISVTDCSQLDALAAVMRRVNTAHPYSVTMSLADVQVMDAYGQTLGATLFYDLGSYAEKLCADDATLLAEVNAALRLAVPYKAHTARFFSSDLYYKNSDGSLPIASFSGLTISDPSTSRFTADKQTTAWWTATH